MANYAKIEDCYIEHGYSEQTATIKIVIKNSDSSKRIEFHNLAHDSFNTDMDLIS